MRIFKTLGHVRKKKEQDEPAAEETLKQSLFQGARQAARKHTLSTGRKAALLASLLPCAEPLQTPPPPPLSVEQVLPRLLLYLWWPSLWAAAPACLLTGLRPACLPSPSTPSPPTLPPPPRRPGSCISTLASDAPGSSPPSCQGPAGVVCTCFCSQSPAV